ncbi:MAG TPA: hypothetical protein VJ826_06015 [Candidatus Polarisedimenticolaceae bacterium]|nr:hypothetical protein [Candidatus Polarisedimenticolaceae bacterium]
MKRRAIFLVPAILVAAVAALVLATAGPPRPLPTPPGTFAFGVTGDSPYLPWEDVQYHLLRQEMDETDLAFVIHVGDIFWRPCSDEHYRRVRARFDTSRHPLIYTPGDNEWADCWEPGSGSFRPLERLAAIRTIFFDDPRRSLGAKKITLESQADDPDHPVLRENARWVHDGVVFATVDLVGSHNARLGYPGRTAVEDETSRSRTAGDAAWVRATFARAREIGATAVVFAFHANMHLDGPPPHHYPEDFEPFVSTLDAEARSFAGPVLIVHGDGHVYEVDRPMNTPNVVRMQVPGSPLVGWVRVVVDTKARDPFSFDEHVVPRWKYW